MNIHWHIKYRAAHCALQFVVRLPDLAMQAAYYALGAAVVMHVVQIQASRFGESFSVEAFKAQATGVAKYLGTTSRTFGMIGG